jgi:Fe-S-cluster containining protein
MDQDKQSKRAPCLKPSSAPLSDKEKAKIMEIALERMVMIEGKVYGLEDDIEPEMSVDCLSMVASCRAVCCTYVFALTQDEVKKGVIKHNPENPYYMARDEDGYCPYLNRETFLCSIHDKRPLRCRKYACPDTAA